MCRRTETRSASDIITHAAETYELFSRLHVGDLRLFPFVSLTITLEEATIKSFAKWNELQCHCVRVSGLHFNGLNFWECRYNNLTVLVYRRFQWRVVISQVKNHPPVKARSRDEHAVSKQLLYVIRRRHRLTAATAASHSGRATGCYNVARSGFVAMQDGMLKSPSSAFPSSLASREFPRPSSKWTLYWMMHLISIPYALRFSCTPQSTAIRRIRHSYPSLALDWRTDCAAAFHIT